MTARVPALVILSLCLVLFPCPLRPAQNEPGLAEPKLLSVFPSGGQRGSTVQVEVRGNFLEKAYAAWFDSGQFDVRFLKVEEVKNQVEQRSSFFDKKEKLPVFRALIEVHAQPQVPAGVYPLRLVSPYGISNAVHFHVADQPVALETEHSHQTIDQAQPVVVPAIVEGKLADAGELDYYSFQVERGDELRFDVVKGEEPSQPEV